MGVGGWLVRRKTSDKPLTHSRRVSQSPVHHSPATMITKLRAVRDYEFVGRSLGDQLMPQRLFLIYFWPRSTVVCPFFASGYFVGVLSVDLWTMVIRNDMMLEWSPLIRELPGKFLGTTDD